MEVLKSWFIVPEKAWTMTGRACSTAIMNIISNNHQGTKRYLTFLQGPLVWYTSIILGFQSLLFHREFNKPAWWNDNMEHLIPESRNDQLWLHERGIRHNRPSLEGDPHLLDSARFQWSPLTHSLPVFMLWSADCSMETSECGIAAWCHSNRFLTRGGTKWTLTHADLKGRLTEPFVVGLRVYQLFEVDDVGRSIKLIVSFPGLVLRHWTDYTRTRTSNY